MDHRSILITIGPHCSAASFTLLLSNDATRTVLFLDSDPYWPWSTTRSYARMLWLLYRCCLWQGTPHLSSPSHQHPNQSPNSSPTKNHPILTCPLDSLLQHLAIRFSCRCLPHTLHYCILGGMLAPTSPLASSPLFLHSALPRLHSRRMMLSVSLLLSLACEALLS